MEGILILNKPDGMTSHDVVSRVRRKLRIKRVGHAGTLDPLATGVLIILVGKATKLFDSFVGMDKSYRATLILGMTTDTADTQGVVTATQPHDHLTEDRIREVFAEFLGESEQLPPMYSAVRHKGRKLYELARKGIVVERQPRKVLIKRLEILRIERPHVEFFLECSKGTYVRQLADDIGRRLGCGACISQIERTKVGPFAIEESIHLEDVDASHLQHWSHQKSSA